MLLILVSTTHAQVSGEIPAQNDSEPFLPADNIADRNAQKTIDPVPASPFSIGRITSIIFALGFSIVLAYFLGALLKKGLRNSQHSLGPQGSFRVIGHISLTPKHMIYMVDVAERILIIAISDHSANTLAEITDAETVATLKNEAELYSAPGPRFMEHLRRATNLLSSA